jgi:hypothetical protein
LTQSDEQKKCVIEDQNPFESTANLTKMLAGYKHLFDYVLPQELQEQIQPTEFCGPKAKESLDALKSLLVDNCTLLGPVKDATQYMARPKEAEGKRDVLMALVHPSP